MYLTLAESTLEQVGTKFVEEDISKPIARGLMKSSEMNEPIYIFKLIRVIEPEVSSRIIIIS